MAKKESLARKVFRVVHILCVKATYAEFKAFYAPFQGAVFVTNLISF